MQEEIIVSGRMNPNIDPHLHIWHWQIPLYLFLGGLAAGILFFAALFVIQGKEEKFPAATRYATLIVPVLLILGLAALFMDLKHKLFFWQLYTTIRLTSPMGWGAWTLMIITPISFIWAALNIRLLFPRWEWPWQWLRDFEVLVIRKNDISLDNNNLCNYFRMVHGYTVFGLQCKAFVEYLNPGPLVPGIRTFNRGCFYHPYKQE